MKIKWWIIGSVILIIGYISLLVGYRMYQEQKVSQERIKIKQIQDETSLLMNIMLHHGTQVKVNKETPLYQYNNGQYEKVGIVYPSASFYLQAIDEFTIDSLYFQIANSSYYIYYDSVSPCSFEPDNRYQNYIPFNIEITTKENTTFYKKTGEKLCSLFESQGFLVIEKTEHQMGVELFDQLVYVKTEEVNSQKEVEQVREKATAIASILYHFIYLNGDTSCQETICHSEEQITSHFSYLQQEQYFTLTTTEVLKFIKGEINLPKKSILITIDDGARAEKFIPFLEQYQLYATLFLVSSWYPKEIFASPYLEIASHTHNMHTVGVCPMGQGGGINCLSEETILKDLQNSRTTLEQTVAMSYPFFEYSDYAIQLVKEAGFEIAFIGGQTKIKVGINPYKVPRYTIFSSTSIGQLSRIISS